MRARLAEAFAAMRRAGEAQIIQAYAIKLASVAVCYRPSEVASVMEALCRERDAALAAFQQGMHAAERAQRKRELAALAKEKTPRGGRLSILRNSAGVRRQFTRAGRSLGRRRRRRRFAIRIRRRWRPAFIRRDFTPG
jgi:hypothetical protein